MTLRRYMDKRLVVLPPEASAYEAARAMADNNIGSVLVGSDGKLHGIVTDRDIVTRLVALDSDAHEQSLADIMSGPVASVGPDSALADVLRAMRDAHSRRVAIVDEGHLVGLVTLDDLLADSAVKTENVRAIVEAQLEDATRLKPEGEMHPVARRNFGLAPQRGVARAESTFRKMLRDVERELEAALGERVTSGRAQGALATFTSLICRRITTDQAFDLIAQLPSRMRPYLERVARGPDRRVDREAVASALEHVAWLEPGSGGRAAEAIGRAVASHVSPGIVENVQGQLPQDMKTLFPSMASAAAGAPTPAPTCLQALVEHLRAHGVSFRLSSFAMPEREPVIADSHVAREGELLETRLVIVGDRPAIACARHGESMDLGRLSASLNAPVIEVQSDEDLPERMRGLPCPLPPIGSLFEIPIVVDELTYSTCARVAFAAFGPSDFVDLSIDDFSRLEAPKVVSFAGGGQLPSRAEPSASHDEPLGDQAPTEKQRAA